MSLRGSARLMTGTMYKPACLKEPDGIHLDILGNHMLYSPVVKVLVPLSGLQMCAKPIGICYLLQCMKQSLRLRAGLNHEHLLSQFIPCLSWGYTARWQQGPGVDWLEAGHFTQCGFFKTWLSAIREIWQTCNRQQIAADLQLCCVRVCQGV